MAKKDGIELYLGKLLSMKPPKNYTKSKDAVTAIYIRVSTDQQAEEGYSIPVQTERLINLCKANGWNNYELYVDGGHSGSTLNRPEMIRLIENVIAGKIERVVVFKLDRISRSQKDTLTLIENILIPFKVAFVSLTENFDTESPQGRTMLGIMSAFAQLERETIKERTSMGRRELVKQGYWRGGGGVPFGYSYDKSKKILVPNADAEIVKKTFELCIDGVPANRIASILGYKSDVIVRNILKRKTYLGVYEYNGEIYEGRHEPLISEKDFQMAQYMLMNRERKDNNQERYLLSGLLECGQCGCKMRYQKWGNSGVRIYCYSRCASNHKRSNIKTNSSCDNTVFNADIIEQSVEKELNSVRFVELEETNEAEMLKNKAQRQIESFSEQKSKIVNTVKNLYDLYAASPSQILYERIVEHENEIKRISNTVLELQEKSEFDRERIERIKQIGGGKKAFSELSFERKKMLIKECVENIIINKDSSIEIHYRLTLKE